MNLATEGSPKMMPLFRELVNKRKVSCPGKTSVYQYIDLRLNPKYLAEG
jgi:hypothetical protein